MGWSGPLNSSSRKRNSANGRSVQTMIAVVIPASFVVSDAADNTFS